MRLDSPLGKLAEYTATYTPSLLFSIERADARGPMKIDDDALPFQGEDVWTGYELTWLGERGKPEVSALRIKVPASSPCIVESKSLKLYLGSLAQTRFANRAELLNTLNSDLGLAFRAPVMVELIELAQIPEIVVQPPGICLDGLDVRLSQYERDPDLLQLDEGQERVVKETVHTNLFRSLCPVTGQPDFATIVIQYLGRPIIRTSLLAYLVSYRNHPAFHEATIEQIFVDLEKRCGPDQLSITGRFLRRGGIDISPFRSNIEDQMPLMRLSRQ
jgi:7-cyano-7-deazaguanine reductase